MVQTLMATRKKSRNRKSSVSIFSSKVKCGDCGSWYGPKVWHSNDAYRKVIWQCNHKFDGQKCVTPTLNEEQIKALFLKDDNTVIGAKERFIAIFERTLAPAFLARMPKELPLLFLSGDADPVGEQGKGVRRAIQSLKDAGVQNIESIFYPRAAGGDQQTGGFRGHCRLVGQTAGKTVKTSKGAAAQNVQQPLYFYSTFRL